jgi:hypothetical protein
MPACGCEVLLNRQRQHALTMRRLFTFCNDSLCGSSGRASMPRRLNRDATTADHGVGVSGVAGGMLAVWCHNGGGSAPACWRLLRYRRGGKIDGCLWRLQASA